MSRPKIKNSFTEVKTTTVSLLAVLCLWSCGDASELSSFTSDGCSAFPDGTLAINPLTINTLWLSCCTDHDIAYWQGGSYEQRLQADKDLRHCVAQTGQEEIAKLMLAGVRVGGTPYLPTTFRWGYGWPYLRGYKTLTPEEQKLVQEKLASYKKSKVPEIIQKR